MPQIIISDDIVRLLICIASQKRGYTDEQIDFLNRMEKQFFPIKENGDDV